MKKTNLKKLGKTFDSIFFQKGLKESEYLDPKDLKKIDQQLQVFNLEIHWFENGEAIEWWVEKLLKWEVRSALRHGSKHQGFFDTEQDALGWIEDQGKYISNHIVDNVIYCSEYENEE